MMTVRDVEERESLGQYLKRERERRGISLREVAKNTRIREPFLQALEEDRYDLLPSPTIVKGFLTAYGKYVGLDLKPLLLRYQDLLKAKPSEASDILSAQRGKEKRIRYGYAGAILVAALLLVALIIVYSNLLKPPGKPIEPPSEKPKESTPLRPEEPRLPPASHAVSPPAPSVPSIPVPSPIRLEAKAVERTWLRMRLDDQPEKEMMLQPGETFAYQATSRIELLVGNAGGMELVLNGRKQEKFGKSGEVVLLIFTSQGTVVKRYEKTKTE